VTTSSSLCSAALSTPIETSLDTNGSSIVPLFYRKFVRSNEDTVQSYPRGPTLSESVEQMFEIEGRKR